MRLTVDELARDEGTVIVFNGHDEDGESHQFACDHRPAQGLVDALELLGEVEVDVESWQVLN